MERIAVDMDGVLADCFQQFVRYEYEETGLRRTGDEAAGKIEEIAFPNAKTYVYQTGFFRTMPVIENSQEILKKLNEKFEVFIVSSATEFPQSLTEKQAWLQDHFPFISWQQMVFCGLKTIVKADIMIDDHFKNLNSFKGKTILFTQPHNRFEDAGRHIRVHNWMEIEKILLSKKKKQKNIVSETIDITPAISRFA